MFREQKFRINLWLLGSAVTVGTFLILEALTSTGRWHSHILSDLGVSAVALIALWGLCAVVWFIYPVYIGTDGLRAPDGIGRVHEVRWDEIRQVSGLLGYYWVRHGKLGKALCIPMFLEDRAGFKESVRRYAPEGNPLRTYLTRT